eukprot:13100-Heterococcus_DN1.PRE.2
MYDQSRATIRTNCIYISSSYARLYALRYHCDAKQRAATGWTSLAYSESCTHSVTSVVVPTNSSSTSHTVNEQLKSRLKRYDAIHIAYQPTELLLLQIRIGEPPCLIRMLQLNSSCSDEKHRMAPAVKLSYPVAHSRLGHNDDVRPLYVACLSEDAVDAIIMQLDHPVQALQLVISHCAELNALRLLADSRHSGLCLSLLHHDAVLLALLHASAPAFALLASRLAEVCALEEVREHLRLRHQVA